MPIEITNWLQGLGLEQYASAFHDNAIDAAVLPELTADDLKDLGVSLVGHRRKLLAAIAALRSDIGSTPDTPVAAAERRQLTVMFATWSARRSSPAGRFRCELMGQALHLIQGRQTDGTAG